MGNKHLAINYRPISLTSTVVKVIEKLIHNRLSNYLQGIIYQGLHRDLRDKKRVCDLLVCEKVRQNAILSKN